MKGASGCVRLMSSVLCLGLAWVDSDNQGTLTACCSFWQETWMADYEHLNANPLLTISQ